MYCKNCGKESDSTKKFCANCGNAFFTITNQQTQNQSAPFSFTKTARKINTSTVIRILVVIAIIGWIAYSNLDDDSISKNNEGLTSFDSGDSQNAILQLQQASEDAVTDDTKMNTLKNLGYVYGSESQYDLSLQTFKEAIKYAPNGSFDYFLISGEIALLEGKPNAAQISYNKAYELNPNNFQINNALNLFYLDLEGVAPSYVNYPKALQHAQTAHDVSEELVKNTARQNLAIAYFFNENYNQAISLFSYTDLNKEPSTAYWLGWAYAYKEDIANAKYYFQKAIDAGIQVEQEVYEYLRTH